MAATPRRCPFKTTALGVGLDCEMTDCAAWSAKRAECAILQAVKEALAARSKEPDEDFKAVDP